MTVSPPSAPILGMYLTGGAFPGAPSAWASGPTTNFAATYLSFDADWATYGAPFVAQCHANGMDPFVELEPWHYDQSAVPFSDITSGVWDTYLTGIGSAIAATRKRVILTFAHEFNVSGQYPWSQGDTGSGPSGGTLTPAEWIAGWQYVYTKINSTANGYALFMWACSAWTGGTTVDPSPWWPGSTYVDMVGIDGYPNTQYGQALGTFAGQIQKTVTAIRNLGWTDDIFISETNLAGMVNSGGESITSFVADMYAAGISGILEFEDAAWGEPQMTAAEWDEYNTAVAAYYGAPSGGGGGGGGSGGGGTPAAGSLTVTAVTPDEVSAASNGTSMVASSVTAFTPPGGSMVRVCATWLDATDALGKTFTCADSNGTAYSLTQQGGDADGGCYLLTFDHVYDGSPSAVTVAITSSDNATADCLIQPYVISGQAADQSTAAQSRYSEVGTSTNSYEIGLKTTQAGSVVFVLAAPNNNNHPVPVPLGSTVTDAEWDDDGVGSHGVIGRSASPTAAPGTVTFGWTSTAASIYGYGVMASEVIPAAAGSGSGSGGSGGAGSAVPVRGLYYPGARLTGTGLRRAVPLAAYKAQDQQVASSVVPVNDNALLLQLEAEGTYYFKCKIGYTGSAAGAGDIRLAWAVPFDAAMGYALYGSAGTVATDGYWETEASVPSVSSNGTVPVACVMKGTVSVASTPGAMQLKWAQHTSSATPTTVLAGSVLTAWRIG